MNTQPNACACTDCIGAACTCGCQSKAVATCGCGCQQGKPCECSVRDLAPRTPPMPVGF